MCGPMREKTPKRQAQDLKDLVVGYVKQETVDPIKSAGKHLAFGVGGAVVISIGVVFLAVGTLRLLQTETTWLDGPWSRLLAYLVVIVALAGGAAASFQVAQARGDAARDDTKKGKR